MPALFIFLCITILFSENVLAISDEPILITISYEMKEIIFDGKWSFVSEWKPSSLTTINQENKQIILRTAHFENFIYVFVDSIDEYSLNKGMDKATICFDGENNKSQISDENDYCFSSTLGHKEGTVFQGNSINVLNGNFQKIPNPDGFIAISSVSDENDRYTTVPHPSYEFRIPLDILQRSDNYGFYLSVYDGESNTFINFPEETKRESFFKIPSPSKWGNIISPDKSLPELNLPFLIFTIMIFSIIIIIQSKRKIGIFR